MLLSTAYFPPVSWFALAASRPAVQVEACENYRKQSYRNRCRIYSAGGVETLSVPIVHEGGPVPVVKARIDYSCPWVQRTKRAIASAYGNSAYFSHYADELFGILDGRHEFLFTLNARIRDFMAEKTGLSAVFRDTDVYVREAEEDYRELIHPKRENTVLRDLGIEKPYFQVFARKYGFIGDLSVMDLLFNEGPDSILYLR